jgi:alcohol dehydrogenase
MRAIVIHEHGGPEKLQFTTDFPVPEPGKGEVVVRVEASSLNYHDIFTRNGMPGIKTPMPMILGNDVAGVIETIGSEVGGWSVGDRVLINPVDPVRGALVGEVVHGGLAQFCKVWAEQLISIPENVTYSEAAALPVAYGTAHRMLICNGKIERGHNVLIIGASGGVGTCCVLLAKSLGANVIATTRSSEKVARLSELGCDTVVDTGRQDLRTTVLELFGKPARRSYEGGVDVVVNFTGGDTWTPCLKLLKRGGKLLTCGATAGFDVRTDLRYVWTYELNIQGSNSWAQSDIEALLQMVSRRELVPVIDSEFELEDAHAAFAKLEDGKSFGKVVVRPGHG